ncbi:MAG: hypothetical protein IBX62_10050 [Coriobacteriia bacterium]|nr:hypothetical protein [Coriobacteriia bacterium]
MAATSRWSLRNIYLYLVCLITLIMVIVGVINAVRASVELIYPDPYAYGPVYSPEEKPGAGPEEQREAAEEQRRLSERSARRQAILNLVGSAATVLVAGPVYLYHWRKIEGELPGQAGEAAAGE